MQNPVTKEAVAPAESLPLVDGWPAPFVDDLLRGCAHLVGSKIDPVTLGHIEALACVVVRRHRGTGALSRRAKVTCRKPVPGLAWQLLITDGAAARPLAVTLDGGMVAIGLAA